MDGRMNAEIEKIEREMNQSYSWKKAVISYKRSMNRLVSLMEKKTEYLDKDDYGLSYILEREIELLKKRLDNIKDLLSQKDSDLQS